MSALFARAVRSYARHPLPWLITMLLIMAGLAASSFHGGSAVLGAITLLCALPVAMALVDAVRDAWDARQR